MTSRQTESDEHLAIVPYTGVSLGACTQELVASVSDKNSRVSQFFDVVQAWTLRALWPTKTDSGQEPFNVKDEFFRTGPFTLDPTAGRSLQRGYMVSPSYFDPIVNAFAKEHSQPLVFCKQRVLSHVLGGVDTNLRTALAQHRLPRRQKDYTQATKNGWITAAPIWASLGITPPLVKTQGFYIPNVYWKLEHPFLLQQDCDEHTMSLVEQFLVGQSTCGRTHADDGDGVEASLSSSDGAEDTEEEGHPGDRPGWRGMYPPCSTGTEASGVDVPAPNQHQQQEDTTPSVRQLGMSDLVQGEINALFPRSHACSNKRKAEEPNRSGQATGDNFDEGTIAMPNLHYLEEVIPTQCEWCAKWRFLILGVHAPDLMERVHAAVNGEGQVHFQCRDCRFTDGASCLISCETPSQIHCPPNPRDPATRQGALDACTAFFRWASDHLEGVPSVVEDRPRQFTDEAFAFYHEHYWRYLWFQQKILPEGIQLALDVLPLFGEDEADVVLQDNLHTRYMSE